jgi:hypothetical protein
MARRTAKVFMTTSVQPAAIGGDRETRILSGGWRNKTSLAGERD